MQDEGAAKVAGVTAATAAEAEAFIREQGVNYPVIAEAGALFESYGVNAVWGSVVYLIGEDGRIVERGIDRVFEALRR